MRVGDLVVYPSKRDRQVHLGRIEGACQYDPSLESSYPNVRAAKWLRAVPRTHFTQGALYEIGSAMSFFQVKNYADEFRTALEGSTNLSPDIEETTRDFVIKRLAQETKGHPFAEFVGHLLNTMG